MTGHDFTMSRARATAGPARERFEFRCWPSGTPTPAAATLQRNWTLSRAETRSDIYLLSPISDGCLVKLRDGAYLEIKQRRADTPPLQRWNLARRMTFPLDTEELLEVAVSLGLAEMPDRSAATSGAHLVAALWSVVGHVHPLPVGKSRLLFSRGTCRAELTRAEWAGKRALSVAIEDPDHDSAMTAIRDLGLDRYKNLSYGEVLWPRRLSDDAHAGA